MKTKFMPLTMEDLNTLPTEVKEEVLSTLKAFNKCEVDFENGKYSVGGGSCIKSKYASDHKFIGIAYVEDIYTLEERKANFKETFGYEPHNLR